MEQEEQQEEQEEEEEDRLQDVLEGRPVTRQRMRRHSIAY
jgi:hypothetical protein